MSSTCMDCGQRCRGARCKLCASERNAPDLVPDDPPECPDCGGRTSGEGVTCADCLRTDDIVGDLDEHDEDLEDLRADGGPSAEENTANPQLRRADPEEVDRDTVIALGDCPDCGSNALATARVENAVYIAECGTESCDHELRGPVVIEDGDKVVKFDLDPEDIPLDDDLRADGGTEETVYVEDTPRRIFGNLLIDGPDGQCAYIYAGIEERCQRDAVAHTYMDHGGERKKVEMCAEHAREDVPEPPTTEQSTLVTDGGQSVEEESAGDKHEDAIIGYVVDEDPQITACVGCVFGENLGPRIGEIRDDGVYGDQIPYPECGHCGEVIRPHETTTVYECIRCGNRFETIRHAQNHRHNGEVDLDLFEVVERTGGEDSE